MFKSSNLRNSPDVHAMIKLCTRYQVKLLTITGVEQLYLWDSVLLCLFDTNYLSHWLNLLVLNDSCIHLEGLAIGNSHIGHWILCSELINHAKRRQGQLIHWGDLMTAQHLCLLVLVVKVIDYQELVLACGHTILRRARVISDRENFSLLTS